MYNHIPSDKCYVSLETLVLWDPTTNTDSMYEEERKAGKFRRRATAGVRRENKGWELNDGLFWFSSRQVMMVYISELEGHVWYLYILETLVQMSWSWRWWRSTRQSSDSIEKEMKSGRESGWSARFLRVAVSYRGQRSEAFIFRPPLRVSVVLLCLAHDVGHMLIKVGCWPAQDAIQQSGRKLFSMDINHSITRGKRSFPTHGSTGSSGKSQSAYFPPLTA